MFMLSLILHMLVALAGGVAAAIVLCGLAWTLFKLVRHPEWGPCFVLLAGFLLLGRHIASSPFLQTAFLFSGLFAAGCWWEGRAWRTRHADDGSASPPEPGA